MNKTKKGVSEKTETSKYEAVWQANPEARVLYEVGGFVFTGKAKAEEYSRLTGLEIEIIYKDGKTTE